MTSEATGQLWNICAWETQTGMQLHSYKGGVSGGQTLSHIAKQYIISAEQSKPLLHVWPINKKVQVNLII